MNMRHVFGPPLRRMAIANDAEPIAKAKKATLADIDLLARKLEKPLAAAITRLTGATFRFNQLNPRLVEYLQQYSLKLIRSVNDQTREGVREFLVGGMTAGANPRSTAVEIKQVIGLTPKQANAVKNFRRELQNFHLKRDAGGWNLGGKISRAPGGAQVYKPDEDGSPLDGIDLRRLRDFRYDATLRASMKAGVPIPKAKIEQMVEAYARKYLKFRSETIARTESMRATNVGVQDAWRQAIEQGQAVEQVIRRQWILAKDERTCETCAPVPGMNPKKGVKFGQPFSTPKGPVMLPPLHPNCRCTVWIRPFEPVQLEGEK
jgi:hypothetical protein